MNKIKKGLGRGLSSLIGETKVEQITNKLSVSDLYPNKFQPRKTFDEDSQSQVMALLWHIKLQKMNSIRGVEIDGDFSWRLSGITDVEQAALEEFMPALKNAPYFSRPNTLQEDVMAAIVNEIKPTPVKQPKSKKRSRR